VFLIHPRTGFVIRTHDFNNIQLCPNEMITAPFLHSENIFYL